MRHLISFLLPLLVLQSACTSEDDDTPKDTAEPQDTAQATDTSVPDDVCGESGICPLTVEDALAECGDGSVDEPTLSATSSAPGTLQVTFQSMQQGCCPQVEVTGEASMRSGEIDAWVSLFDDLCQCVCSLDISFTLGDIPAGEWELVVEGQSTQVTVE